MSTTIIHDVSLSEIEDHIYPLRQTVAMLDFLKDYAPGALTYEELCAWQQLTTFGITKSVDQLRRSIDDLMRLVSAGTRGSDL